MSMQLQIPDQVVPADQVVLTGSWTLFCTECSQKMRIIMAAPAQDGSETRTYECACGHREWIDVALH
jgi:DNA-directed RNA polymerase subunit RPC12/RpoP